MRIELRDQAATQELAGAFGPQLKRGDTLALTGDLGAGKTTFTSDLLKALGSAAQVSSPTFDLVHAYSGGRLPVWHADLYRIENEADLLAIGWDDIVAEAEQGLLIVEWADKFPGFLPADAIWLKFSIDGEGCRSVGCEACDRPGLREVLSHAFSRP
jgi:tRNA threonylcarbamoyladenosine biosynthesis protein TsaE